jgi:hypothetical protein
MSAIQRRMIPRITTTNPDTKLAYLSSTAKSLRPQKSLSWRSHFATMLSMLSWLFGKKDQATRGEDCVWMSVAARLKGIGREVERLAKDGCSIVVVAWTLPAFDELARELERHKPLLCRDLFGFDALRAQLSRAGAVAIALGNTVSSDPKTETSVAVEILVCGRNAARATDDAIIRFADLVGVNARVTFHVSMDDALLKDYIATLKPLLYRLDVPHDESHIELHGDPSHRPGAVEKRAVSRGNSAQRAIARRFR